MSGERWAQKMHPHFLGCRCFEKPTRQEWRKGAHEQLAARSQILQRCMRYVPCKLAAGKTHERVICRRTLKRLSFQNAKKGAPSRSTHPQKYPQSVHINPKPRKLHRAVPQKPIDFWYSHAYWMNPQAKGGSTCASFMGTPFPKRSLSG